MQVKLQREEQVRKGCGALNLALIVRYKIYRSLDPANAGPRCSTAALVKAARLSWGPTADRDDVDLNDVISILSSLIDQVRRWFCFFSSYSAWLFPELK